VVGHRAPVERPSGRVREKGYATPLAGRPDIVLGSFLIGRFCVPASVAEGEMKRESRSEAWQPRRTRVSGDGGGLAARGNLRQGGPTLGDERHLRGQLVVPRSPSTLLRADSAPRNLAQARVQGVETSDPQPRPERGRYRSDAFEGFCTGLIGRARGPATPAVSQGKGVRGVKGAAAVLSTLAALAPGVSGG